MPLGSTSSGSDDEMDSLLLRLVNECLVLSDGPLWLSDEWALALFAPCEDRLGGCEEDSRYNGGGGGAALVTNGASSAALEGSLATDPFATLDGGFVGAAAGSAFGADGAADEEDAAPEPVVRGLGSNLLEGGAARQPTSSKTSEGVDAPERETPNLGSADVGLGCDGVPSACGPFGFALKGKLGTGSKFPPLHLSRIILLAAAFV